MGRTLVIRNKVEIMDQQKLTFHTYEELKYHLKNCVHWNSTTGVGQYDLVGIGGLLSAVLENLTEHTASSELGDLKDVLSSKNLKFLEMLLKE